MSKLISLKKVSKSFSNNKKILVLKKINYTFDISLFPEEIYFLSTMPSEINPTSIFIISLCSIFITIIVSIFPAIKASKLDPVKGLKYE